MLRVLAMIGAGVFVAIVWFIVDATLFSPQPTDHYVTVALAAANGAFIYWNWSPTK